MQQTVTQDLEPLSCVCVVNISLERLGWCPGSKFDHGAGLHVRVLQSVLFVQMMLPVNFEFKGVSQAMHDQHI